MTKLLCNSPSIMITGREMKLSQDLFRKIAFLRRRTFIPDVDLGFKEKLEKFYEFSRKSFKLQVDKAKAQVDVHAIETIFKRVNPVWLYNPTRKKGLHPNLRRPVYRLEENKLASLPHPTLEVSPT